jgi:ribosome biogenesis GTPase
VVYTPTTDTTAVIERILPRFTTIARKESNASAAQVLATNVDRMLVVQGLDSDFNVRRLERYLLLAHHSGCQAAVVLTKRDLCTDLDAKLAAVHAVNATVPVITTALTTGIGLDALQALLTQGETVVLLGSSGAGKSTIINALAGNDVQETAAVRSFDGKGRHTTTRRELFVTGTGGLVIDTPGMRELGILPSDTAASEELFEHIEELAAQCRFADCDHERSAGCAIQAALHDGSLDSKQLASYYRILEEQQREAARMAAAAQRKPKQDPRPEVTQL